MEEEEFTIELPENATAADALVIAKELHHSGKPAQAAAVYERIIKLAPDYPEALNFFGILKFQSGKWKEGAAMLRRSVKLAPDYHDAHANLGMMLRQVGEFAAAEKHLKRAIDLDPAAPSPRLSLANLRRSQGRNEDALRILRKVLETHPGNVLIHHALTDLLQSMGRMDEAAVHFRQTEAINPAINSIRQSWSYLLADEGRLDEARAQMRRWIELDPKNPKPRHMLAAYGGAPVPERATDEMVSRTFNDFARSFDRKLAELEYRAPEYVADSIGRFLSERNAQVDLLDAGCGTGLLGPLVRPLARRLVGVDLSDGMLERAKARKVYDELIEGELTAFLEANADAYDVVASADTLCYFGALNTAAVAAHAALRPGGGLVFTVEEAVDATSDYVLQVHGRYSHRRGYVEETLAQAGFEAIELESRVLRKEMEKPVMGLVVSARRKG